MGFYCVTSASALGKDFKRLLPRGAPLRAQSDPIPLLQPTTPTTQRRMRTEKQQTQPFGSDLPPAAWQQEDNERSQPACARSHLRSASSSSMEHEFSVLCSHSSRRPTVFSRDSARKCAVLSENRVSPQGGALESCPHAGSHVDRTRLGTLRRLSSTPVG